MRHEVLDCWWLEVPLGKGRLSTFHTESLACIGNGTGSKKITLIEADDSVRFEVFNLIFNNK